MEIGGIHLRYINTFIVFLCLLLLTMNTTIVASTKEAIIQENNVNLRSGPGTSYEKTGQVHKDETYTISNQEEGWVELQLDGESAWVSSDFVFIQGNNASEVAKTSQYNTIKVPIDQTQIRSGPSTENDIIHFANKGDELQIVDEEDEWYKIKLEETEGYIYKDLLIDNKKLDTNGLRGKTIVIDPGHGGNDSGAISASEALEKDITYKTADILSQELSSLGAEVIMTRDQKTFVSLASRAVVSNTIRADAFISLHYNSIPNIPDTTGINTYYYQEQYEPLANYIQQEVIKETGDRDRGVSFGDFQVIRQNLMPGVLIELGFISNPEIDQLLATNAYQKKMVSGIVNGLQRYFAQQK